MLLDTLCWSLAAQLREELGLNDHIILQYFTWLKNIVTGDFGYSLQSGQQISEILALRMPAESPCARL